MLLQVFVSISFFFFFFLQDHLNPVALVLFKKNSKLRLEAFESWAFYLSSRDGEDDVDFLFGFCIVVNGLNSDPPLPSQAGHRAV